jgi:uncharacterized protein
MLRLLDYFLLAFPGVVIATWAQWRIARTYRIGLQTPAAADCTGPEAARAILSAEGLAAIAIEPAAGELSDHYDPSRKVLRLSHRIHDGRSLTALGVAAHEAGHAIQEAAAYPRLVIRNLVVPLASIGSQLSWLLILAGILLGIDRLILAGVILFSSLFFFQLLNVPVELDSSRRARLALVATGLVENAEEPVIVRVLNAAAWTYVALTLTGVVRLFAVARSR